MCVCVFSCSVMSDSLTPVDYSPPGSSVPESELAVLQSKDLERAVYKVQTD